MVKKPRLMRSKTCYTSTNMNKNQAIIVGSIIVAVTIIVAFYILNSGKTPVSSNTNQTLVTSEKQPSKSLKAYFDNAGFSFQYPNDVQVDNIEIKDNITYSNLELTSNQTKGKVLIKVVDTQLKSVDDWFAKEGLKGDIKEIKIGEISGGQLQMSDKVSAVAINQDILFTIEVDTQNQKYWQSVYDTILSSFNFVPQEESAQTQEPFLDDSLGDAVLEEEIVE